MDFDSFAQMIQTFGASAARWETDQPEATAQWAKTRKGAKLLQAEKILDTELDSLQPPLCTGLIERIQSVVMNEKTQRQIVLFWRISPWVSFLFMIGGFYMGWYQNHQDFINTQSYFTTMFEDLNYEQY
ncbi:MAG: hypothetical protein IJ752_03230 [Alphaproteobacteria bacterium]|nr:hypothetical protein [Alphaproteobacteria bacterium]